MIGVAIAKRAWPDGSAEWEAADAARHLYDYRTALLTKQPGWSARHTREYLALLQTGRREQDLMRQQLVLMGLPPEPPGVRRRRDGTFPAPASSARCRTCSSCCSLR